MTADLSEANANLQRKSELTVHQLMGRTASTQGDHLTAHMHYFLHAIESGDGLSDETEAFFTGAFLQFSRFRSFHPQASAREIEKELIDALQLKKQPRGRPDNGYWETTEFKVALAVQRQLKPNSSTPIDDALSLTQVIKNVAKNSGQTFETVAIARHKQKTFVDQEIAGELAVKMEITEPRNRSIGIAKELVMLASNYSGFVELVIPVEGINSDGLTLSFPPAQSNLQYLNMGNEDKTDLARVLSACTKNCSSSFAVYFGFFSPLELEEIGENLLRQVKQNSGPKSD